LRGAGRVDIAKITLIVGNCHSISALPKLLDIQPNERTAGQLAGSTDSKRTETMPEPLKNLYNKELLSSLCNELVCLYDEFDSESFINHVFDDEWSDKELKERMRHISEALRKYLPQDYSEAVEILMNASSKFRGFEYMFFPEFAGLYGLDEYEVSMPALEHFTKYSSSEFAVRPFIQKYNAKMMEQMEFWAESDNHHVRRLASEGCRPRLPWAMALSGFKEDPAPVLSVLEKLKNDESEYVRRSVANNLNDISKDNPQTVIGIARKWSGDNAQTDRIVKHACRTLLKQGESEIMALFGFAKPEHISLTNFAVQKSVDMGDDVSFSFTLKSRHQMLGKLRMEYAIDFMRKNGKLSRKLFKLSESENTAKEKSITKSHSFRKISARQYHVGCHGIAVIVNGHELAHKNFQLNEKS